MKYSIIIPVYNRPDEVGELLRSLRGQTLKDFEVVIVEDGSSVPCREVVEQEWGEMEVSYFLKENGGPGPARNYGAERAKGEYLIILDSDCVLPEGFLAAVDEELLRRPTDAWGGPDRAHPDFTTTQKAINYAMTSFFTTGGIRGGKKRLDKFYPRSFNLGVRRDVFSRLGGFSAMRFGEDIDFSLRIFEGGHTCRLFPEAWVWHKRRTDFRKFFRQVHNSGIARIDLQLRHPGSMKIVHMLPAVFTVGVVLLLIGSAWVGWLLWPIVLFALLILVDATGKERSLIVGVKAVGAAFVQLIGYGTGFLRAVWTRLVLKRGSFEAFKDNFYK